MPVIHFLYAFGILLVRSPNSRIVCRGIGRSISIRDVGVGANSWVSLSEKVGILHLHLAHHVLEEAGSGVSGAKPGINGAIGVAVGEHVLDKVLALPCLGALGSQQ